MLISEGIWRGPDYYENGPFPKNCGSNSVIFFSFEGYHLETAETLDPLMVKVFFGNIFNSLRWALFEKSGSCPVTYPVLEGLTLNGLAPPPPTTSEVISPALPPDPMVSPTLNSRDFKKRNV